MPPTLSAATLTSLVRTLYTDPTATMVDSQMQSLTGGSGEGLGLYRVWGQAERQNEECHWSLVLKILSPETSGAMQTDWNYWRREADVYESGLLATLPDPLRTPHCYAVQDQPDGTCWIWLEDLGPAEAEPWTTETYWHVGHALGQFNGAYVTGTPLPNAPWLNRSFLPQWLDRTPGMARLHAALSHPLVRQLYPDDVLTGYRQLWAMRKDLLATVAQLPQTFCHLDAFPSNLFTRTAGAGDKTLVAIDWAYAGIDALGAELAALTFAGVSLLHRMELHQAQANAEAAFSGYVAGLTSIGWRGDQRTMRLGYLAAALLRYGVGMVPVSLSIVTDPKIEDWAEPVYGYPIAEMIDYWVEVARWRLVLIEELRSPPPI